jgi:hypothetical protein
VIGREEALRMARATIEGKPPKSYVETSRVLSEFLLHDEKTYRTQLVENLGATQARCTELLEQRRTLVRLIENIASNVVGEIIDEVVTAAKAMQ